MDNKEKILSDVMWHSLAIATSTLNNTIALADELLDDNEEFNKYAFKIDEINAEIKELQAKLDKKTK